MATWKDRHNDIHKGLDSGLPAWYYWLSAHALFHGGGIFVVTGSLLMGIIETLSHWIIDYSKCENWVPWGGDLTVVISGLNVQPFESR